MDLTPRSEQAGGEGPTPTNQYEGHESIGFSCLRRGAYLKPAPRWRELHDEWHERLG